MLPLISSLAPPVLASSGDDKWIIFIVIALITVISKVIEWVKKRGESQETFQPEQEARREPMDLDMGEILRRAILEEQQSGIPSPARTAREENVRKQAAKRASRRAARHTPRPSIVPDTEWEPVEKEESPPSLDVMQQAEAALTRPSVEEHAQSSLDQTYATTTAAYQDLPAVAAPIENISPTPLPPAAPTTPPIIRRAPIRRQSFFDSPESVRQAILLHEILSKPKGII